MEKIIFNLDGKNIELELIADTVVNNQMYILAKDNDEAFILKLVNTDDDEQIYEILTDDVETECVLKIFNELVDEFEIEE